MDSGGFEKKKLFGCFAGKVFSVATATTAQSAAAATAAAAAVAAAAKKKTNYVCGRWVQGTRRALGSPPLPSADTGFTSPIQYRF